MSVIEALTADDKPSERAQKAEAAFQARWRKTLEICEARKAKRTGVSIKVTEPKDSPGQIGSPEPEPSPPPLTRPEYPPSVNADLTDQEIEEIFARAAEPIRIGHTVAIGGDGNDIDELLKDLAGGEEETITPNEKLGEHQIAAAEAPEVAPTAEPEPTHVIDTSPALEPERRTTRLSEIVSVTAEARSKIVSAPEKGSDASPSRIVSTERRRSPENDAKIVEKMRSFRPADVSSSPASLVIEFSSSFDRPTPMPANDNSSIPVWSLTGDLVTAVCAAVALQLDDNPAIAFTFNLTPEAIDVAKRNPKGFIDFLKRPLDQHLNRAGIALPYFFAVDIDDRGRLHIHGGFRYPLPSGSFSMERRLRRNLQRELRRLDWSREAQTASLSVTL